MLKKRKEKKKKKKKEQKTLAVTRTHLRLDQTIHGNYYNLSV